MTPQFVEIAIGGGPLELVPVSDIKRVRRTASRSWVEVELLSPDGEWLRVTTFGRYEDWAERLGVRLLAEVDGQELADAVSRYEQEARA
jgi:hypothetical protein